ncbi:LysR family transcriptional regulator [Methylobacterium planeticum]|uniref:LysR family transcriptional regulator n=1 Tax=Methylobacterium planeticum TaxID=2615211 RepID=A0A6N6MUF0_9HYPH|nr:LysR family transcriptional regulator [Methylobacterium planeticum]KAB1074739.1 LysR family transcriptional regulator [Methylobacterium planeticum]
MALVWDDFRLVKAIADRGGLTAAAEHLGINHSTAFRRLAAIEAGLDARLFERHRSGYVPTSAGTAMLAAASRMDEDVARFTREVAGQAQTPAGELRITTAASFVSGVLVPMLGRFAQAYPLIRLDVIVSEEALNLSRRDADVAIRASDNPPPTLIGRRLARIAWAVYGREADGPGLENRLWVSPSEAVAGGAHARFVRMRAGRDRIVLQLNTVLGLAEAIEAGIGIGPLPCLQGDLSPALMRLTEPAPDLASTLWLLTHPDLRHAPRVRAFMDFIGGEMSARRALFEGRSARAAT